MSAARLTVLSLALLAFELSAATPDGMSFVPPGVFQPFFKNISPQKVRGFYLDQTQVTNAEYLTFLKANRSWAKGSAKRIFADAGYLRGWTSPESFPAESAESPVTDISQFAARAYCAWRGKRLPTLAEWEYAAGADPSHPMTDAENARLLAWYERNSTGKPGRVRNVSNLHGIYDMHGLVWEWVDDFNSVMISDESREGGSDKQMFCGGGAANAADFRNYAAFMRYAFRSSLRSNFTSSSLGFRCARNQ